MRYCVTRTSRSRSVSYVCLRDHCTITCHLNLSPSQHYEVFIQWEIFLKCWKMRKQSVPVLIIHQNYSVVLSVILLCMRVNLSRSPQAVASSWSTKLGIIWHRKLLLNYYSLSSYTVHPPNLLHLLCITSLSSFLTCSILLLCTTFVANASLQWKVLQSLERAVWMIYLYQTQFPC